MLCATMSLASTMASAPHTHTYTHTHTSTRMHAHALFACFRNFKVRVRRAHACPACKAKRSKAHVTHLCRPDYAHCSSQVR